MQKYHDFNTGNNWLDESLENYLMHGFEPGGFLTSVLANDLYFAVGRADHWNKQNLPNIVNEVIHKMPSWSYGSYQRVKEWCADKDGCRSDYAKRMQEQRMMDILSGKTVVPKYDENIPF